MLINPNYCDENYNFIRLFQCIISEVLFNFKMSHFNFDQMLSEAVELGQSFIYFETVFEIEHFLNEKDISISKGEENCGSIKKRNGS